MTTPDAKAAGEFQVFYCKEIVPLKGRLEDGNDDGMSDPFLVDEDIEALCRKAWEGGRAYGRREG